MENKGFGTPLFTKKEVRVEEEEHEIFIDDIVNIKLSPSVWNVADSIVKEEKEFLNSKRKEIEESDAYKKVREGKREVVQLGNELLVLSKDVYEEYKKRKGFRGRFHKFYSSVPKRTASSLSDFILMTRYREKKGLIQHYYYLKTTEISEKYFPLIKWTPKELLEKQKTLKGELEKLSYAGKTSDVLKDELEDVEKEIAKITRERQTLEAKRDSKITELLDEEKKVINDILKEMRSKSKISSRYSICTDQHSSGFNENVIRGYIVEILNKAREEYNKQVKKFLQTVENWEEIYDSDELTRKLQEKVDKIKKAYLEKEGVLLEKIKTTVREKDSVYIKRYESVVADITEQVRELNELLPYLKEQVSFYKKEILKMKK